MSNIKYRALLCAIEEGNLTSAANKLNYTQPGISHMIAALEKDLGFPLLVRMKNGVAPTEEANKLLFYVRQMVNAEDRIVEISHKIKGVETGTVRIGSFFSVSVHWLPEIIRSFEKKHPEINLRLTEGNSAEIVEGIRDGSLDLGFISGPQPDGMEFIPIKKDPIMAILPKNHPLTSKSVVDLDQLIKYPFIYPSENAYEDIYKDIEKEGRTIEIKYRVKGDEAILAMISAGLGVSLMPNLLLLKGTTDNYVVKPLNKKYERLLGIVVRSWKYASPAVKSFVNTAEKILNK